MMYHWESGSTSGIVKTLEEAQAEATRHDDGVSPIVVRRASAPEIARFSMVLEYMGIVNSWEEFQEMYGE